MRLPHFIDCHWGKWSDPVKGVAGTWYQFRTCKKCNLVEKRILY